MQNTPVPESVPKKTREDGLWALMSFLWRAAQSGDASEVERLLAEGADPNMPDPGGEAPLHLVAYGNSPRACRALLAAGADPNARNRYGETPLIKAAGWGKLEAAIELLQAGADPDARSESGEDFIERARRRPDVADALKAMLLCLKEKSALQERSALQQCAEQSPKKPAL